MTSGAVWVCILLVVVVFLAAIVIKDHLKTWKERKKQDAEDLEEAEGVAPRPVSPRQSTAPFGNGGDRGGRVPTPTALQSSSQQEPEVDPEPEAEEEEGAVDSFHKRLEEAVARGEEFKEAFRRTLSEQGDGLDFDDALQEAFDMNFKMEDLVALMAERHHTLQDVANFVNDKESPDFEDLFKAIAPVATGDSAAAKAEEILDVVSSFFDLGNDEGEALVTLLTDLGCSAEEIATLAYQKTGMDLGEVIAAAKIADQPELVAALAKKLDADLSDEDPYRALRDGDADFVKMATLLRACGKDAVEVLDAESTYDSSNLSTDDLKQVMEDLLKAGFTPEEALDGIYHADFTNDQNSGAIVAALSDAEVPINDIVQLILKEDIDEDDLDGELRDANVDTRTCVRILHALFEAKDLQKQSA